jgi:hypothetical protein
MERPEEARPFLLLLRNFFSDSGRYPVVQSPSFGASYFGGGCGSPVSFFFGGFGIFFSSMTTRRSKIFVLVSGSSGRQEGRIREGEGEERGRRGEEAGRRRGEERRGGRRRRREKEEGTIYFVAFVPFRLFRPRSLFF